MSFDSPVMIMLHMAAFAFLVSMAFSGFMVFAGLLDQPGHRSNHKYAIPTAGGVGVVSGLGAGMLALALFYPAYANQNILGSLTALGLGVALLGLFDDIYDVSSKLKFVAAIMLAGAAVFVIGPPKTFPLVTGGVALPYWLGFAGAMLWVFVVTNAVNFMDGSNGLMAGSMTISFVALCMVSVLVGASTASILSFVMAASLAGFLPYNVGNQAKIFSGDVGSLFVGFVFACASLLLVREAPAFGLLFVGPLLFLPFLTDILLTMLLRTRRRENLLLPHSSHLYQRMIRAGRTHVFISIIYALGSLLMAIIVIAGLWVGIIKALSFLVLWVCAFSMIYVMVHNRLN